MISALVYLHKKGIAHYDLKPENIMFDKNNILKIVDFGFGEIYKKGEQF